jgi:hypothetical protein
MFKLRTLRTGGDLSTEWWFNFWSHHTDSVYQRLIAGDLGKKYGFKFHDILPDGNGFILEFECAEDATAFVLKWS